MITEAIDTALAWLEVLAAAAAIVLIAAMPLVTHTARRHTPAWARGPIRAALHARRTRRWTA